MNENTVSSGIIYFLLSLFYYFFLLFLDLLMIFCDLYGMNIFIIDVCYIAIFINLIKYFRFLYIFVKLCSWKYFNCILFLFCYVNKSLLYNCVLAISVCNLFCFKFFCFVLLLVSFMLFAYFLF